MRDLLIHARKTILGLDLSFGQTTTTGCGKRRQRALTVVGPTGVTCPACRVWGEQTELQQAATADSLADYLTDGRVRRDHSTPEDFRDIARQHRAGARAWAGDSSS